VGHDDVAVLVAGAGRLAVAGDAAAGAALAADPHHVGPVLGRATVVGVGRRVPHAVDVDVGRRSTLGLLADRAVAGVVGPVGGEGLDRPRPHPAVEGHLGLDVVALAADPGAVVGRLPLDEGGLLAVALGEGPAGGEDGGEAGQGEQRGDLAHVVSDPLEGHDSISALTTSRWRAEPLGWQVVSVSVWPGVWEITL